MQSPEIIIIGGGLSGLATAYYLEQEGKTAHILEGRNRLGGRIYTHRSEEGPPIEMGATWLGKKHHHLMDLLGALDIDIRQQYMGPKGFYEPMSMVPPQLVDLPTEEDPTYRIAGGSDNLVQTLADRLNGSQILLDQAVTSLQKNETKCEIKTEKDLFQADIVVSTLPPKLLVEQVHITPPLPDDLRNIAALTDTWMADAIKVGLTFEKPFWRKPDSSGTIYSNVGPVYECYDHSSNNRYALKGFMKEAYHSVSRARRKKHVIQQLRRYYGEKADHYQRYHELVWRHEPFSYAPYEQDIIPHQNNGHSVFQNSFLDGRLLLSGSETASEFPGYMDGAVESARRTVRRIKSCF